MSHKGNAGKRVKPNLPKGMMESKSTKKRTSMRRRNCPRFSTRRRSNTPTSSRSRLRKYACWRSRSGPWAVLKTTTTARRAPRCRCSLLQPASSRTSSKQLRTCGKSITRPTHSQLFSRPLTTRQTTRRTQPTLAPACWRPPCSRSALIRFRVRAMGRTASTTMKWTLTIAIRINIRETLIANCCSRPMAIRTSP